MRRKKNITKPTVYNLIELEKYIREQNKVSDSERMSAYDKDIDKLLQIAAKTNKKRTLFNAKLINIHLFRNLYLKLSFAHLIVIAFLALTITIISFHLSKHTDEVSSADENLACLSKIEDSLQHVSENDVEAYKDIKKQFKIAVEQADKIIVSNNNHSVKSKINNIIKEISDKDTDYAMHQLEMVKKTKQSIQVREKNDISKDLDVNYTYIKSFKDYGYNVDLFNYANVAFDINDELDNKESAKEWFIRIIEQRKDDIKTAKRALQVGEWFIDEKEFVDAKNIFLYILTNYNKYENIRAFAQINLAYCFFNVGRDIDLAQSIETIVESPETLSLSDDTSNRIKGMNLLLKFCDSNGNLNDYAKRYLDLKHSQLAESLFYIARKCINYVQYPTDVSTVDHLTLWESDDTFYKFESAPTQFSHSVKKYRIVKSFNGLIEQHNLVEIDQNETMQLSERLYEALYNVICGNKDTGSSSNVEKINYRVYRVTRIDNFIDNESVILMNIQVNDLDKSGTKIVLFKGPLENLDAYEVNLTGDYVQNNLLHEYRVGTSYYVVDVDRDGKKDFMFTSGLQQPKVALVLFQTMLAGREISFTSTAIHNNFASDINFVVCEDFNNDDINEIIVAYKSWNKYSLVMYHYDEHKSDKFSIVDEFLLGTAHNYYVLNEGDKKYFLVNSIIEPSNGDYYISHLNKHEAKTGIFFLEITTDNKFKTKSDLLLQTDFLDPTNFFIFAKQYSEFALENIEKGYFVEYNHIRISYFDRIESKNRLVFSHISALDNLNENTPKYYLTDEGIIPIISFPPHINVMQSFNEGLNRLYLTLDKDDIDRIRDLNYKVSEKYRFLRHCELLELFQMHKQNLDYIENSFSIALDLDSRTAVSYLNSVNRLLNEKVAITYDELNSIPDVDIFKEEKLAFYQNKLSFIIQCLGDTQDETIKSQVSDFIAKYILQTNDIHFIEAYLDSPDLPTRTREILSDIYNSFNLKSVIEYKNGVVIENGKIIDNNTKFDEYYSFPLNIVNEAYDQKLKRNFVNISIKPTHYLGGNRLNEDGSQSIDKPKDAFFGNKVRLGKNASYKVVLDIDYDGIYFGNDIYIGLYKTPEAYENSNQIVMEMKKLDNSAIRFSNSGGGMNLLYGSRILHTVNHPARIVTDMGFAFHGNHRSENYRFIMSYNNVSRQLSYCVIDKNTEQVLYNAVQNGIDPLSEGQYYFGVGNDINQQIQYQCKMNFRLNRISLFGDKIDLIKNNGDAKQKDTCSYIYKINRLILSGDKSKIVAACNDYLKFLNSLYNNVLENNKELVTREIVFVEFIISLYQYSVTSDDNALRQIFETWSKFKEIEKEYLHITRDLIPRLNDYLTYDEFVLNLGKAICKYDEKLSNLSVNEVYQYIIDKYFAQNDVNFTDSEDLAISLYLLTEFNQKKDVSKSQAMTWINTHLLLESYNVWRFQFYDNNSMCLPCDSIKGVINSELTIDMLLYLQYLIGSDGFIERSMKFMDDAEKLAKEYSFQTLMFFGRNVLRGRFDTKQFRFLKYVNNELKLYRAKYRLVLERMQYQKKYLDLQYGYLKRSND